MQPLLKLSAPGRAKSKLPSFVATLHGHYFNRFIFVFEDPGWSLNTSGNLFFSGNPTTFFFLPPSLITLAWNDGLFYAF